MSISAPTFPSKNSKSQFASDFKIFSFTSHRSTTRADNERRLRLPIEYIYRYNGSINKLKSKLILV